MMKRLLLSLTGLAIAVAAAESPGLKGSATEPQQQQHRKLEDPDIDLGSILGIACFSEVATVQVQNAGTVAMRDLQVGDKVLTAANDYQPVYSFGHYSPTTVAEFVQIHTVEATLELTGNHLVFGPHKDHPVRADSLKVGDDLRGLKGLQKIIEINTVSRPGLYAPFTPVGTVVVNGIVASSYISLQEGKNIVELQNGVTFMSQHDYVHMGLAPMRLLCMGISSSYCTRYNDQGLPFYVALSVDVNLWANQQSVAVQTLTFGTILLLTGACWAVETLLGAAWAPLAVFAGVILAWQKIAAAKKQKTL